MPATEPRAAAPALPMIVAAPAATRGAARPPVTPVREKQPVGGKGGSGNVACWVLPLSASHHLPWRLLTILLTKHPLCAWGHLPLILCTLHSCSQPGVIPHSAMHWPVRHQNLSRSWPYRLLCHLRQSPGLSKDNASISSGFLSSSGTPLPIWGRRGRSLGPAVPGTLETFLPPQPPNWNQCWVLCHTEQGIKVTLGPLRVLKS